MKAGSSHETERVRQDIGPGWGGEGVDELLPSVIRVKTTCMKFLGEHGRIRPLQLTMASGTSAVLQNSVRSGI